MESQYANANILSLYTVEFARIHLQMFIAIYCTLCEDVKLSWSGTGALGIRSGMTGAPLLPLFWVSEPKAPLSLLTETCFHGTIPGWCMTEELFEGEDK